MRDWVANVDNTFYIIGTVAGPHPYPMMVRDFQSVIGKECIEQMPEMLAAQKAATEQPDVVVACVGGGSNAMGIFHPYIPFEKTRLIGVEAAGEGLESGKHSASLQKGSAGVLHGNRTFILQDDNGQITETHSISAGLDYPGVGPEHAWLQEIGRAEYVGITDKEALDAFHYLCRTEGIIPALESSHAVAYAMKLAKTMRADQSILVNLSGRGDKDIGTVADLSGADFTAAPAARGSPSRAASNPSRWSNEPHRIHIFRTQGARPQGADSLCDRGLPVCRYHPRAHARHGGCRGRRDRAGCAVFRPHGRRPGHPESGRKSFGSGYRHGSGAGPCARIPQAQQHHARGADGLCQPRGTLRPRFTARAPLCAMRPRQAWMACSSWTTRPKNAKPLPPSLRAHGMDLIFLLAPTSTDERMAQVARVASGYVYYVSLKGVTGSGALDTTAVEQMLPRIRQHVHMPVGVGFGIRDAATAQAIGKVADAVVIGSRIIQLIEDQNRRGAHWSTSCGVRKALDA
jgi:hypothetical protein